jgi:sugar phosphate isomerase/epimerase
VELRLACADFSFPLLSHDHVLDLIAQLDIKGVDIGLFAGRSHLQPADVTSNIPAAARALSEKVQSRGLEFADIFHQPAGDFQSLAANHPDAGERRRSREAFLRMLEFTARCNATHMTQLPGVVWEGETPDASLKRCSEELAWRAEQAGSVGITYSVEAHLGSVAPTPETALRLIEMTPGLTLTLDYTHFTYQGIPDAQIEPLVPHASHFHARGGCKSRLQAPLKENTISYPQILRAMDRDGYTGYVGVEYVWIDWERCNEVDNLSETVLLRDLLRNACRQ